MSDVWTGIAGEFLHSYPRGTRLLVVAGADADRSRRVADDLSTALRDAGQSVQRAHVAHDDEQGLRSEIIDPFRAARDPEILVVSGAGWLLDEKVRGIWNFSLWQLCGAEPPHIAADALVDVSDPAHPVRRFADYCAAPTSWPS